jgi:hypothetical protein
VPFSVLPAVLVLSGMDSWFERGGAALAACGATTINDAINANIPAIATTFFIGTLLFFES